MPQPLSYAKQHVIQDMIRCLSLMLLVVIKKADDKGDVGSVGSSGATCTYKNLKMSLDSNGEDDSDGGGSGVYL